MEAAGPHGITQWWKHVLALLQGHTIHCFLQGLKTRFIFLVSDPSAQHPIRFTVPLATVMIQAGRVWEAMSDRVRRSVPRISVKFRFRVSGPFLTLKWWIPCNQQSPLLWFCLFDYHSWFKTLWLIIHWPGASHGNNHVILIFMFHRLRDWKVTF